MPDGAEAWTAPVRDALLVGLDAPGIRDLEGLRVHMQTVAATVRGIFSAVVGDPAARAVPTPAPRGVGRAGNLRLEAAKDMRFSIRTNRMAHIPPSPATAKSDTAPRVLAVGDAAPAFDLLASFGRRVSTTSLAGSPYVLYFYPKADTSGCTKEACEFQEALGALAASAGTLAIVGISKDPVPAIEAFARKFSLEFPLATDEAGTTLEAYGVWVGKSMYGRRYMGIERTTLLVDAGGRIARIWNKVKVPGHAAEVVKAAGSLA